MKIGLRLILFPLIGVLMFINTLDFNSAFAAETKQSSHSVLRIGSQTQILPLDPFHTHETWSVHMLDVVFNKLVRLNERGEMEPDLAERWDVSTDGKTYTFYLREEVYFHNKAPFSSADVIASYLAYIHPEVDHPSKNIFEKVETVSTPNSKTVIFKLKETYAPFLFDLKLFYILPSEIANNIEAIKKFTYKPVGTGSFYFEELQENKKLILKKYPYYHEGAAKLDEIVMLSYDSAETVWTALMRNEIDLAFLLNQEDYEITKQDLTFRSFAVPSSHFYYALTFNHSKPLFADKRFRKAISCAIDRNAIIERVLKGYGDECSGPFIKGSWGENPEVAPFSYNPKKSIELLKELGYLDENGDGVLEKEGKNLEIEIKFHGVYEERTNIAYLIRQYLQEIGIKVRLKAEQIADMGFVQSKKGDFDIELRTIKNHVEPSLAVSGWHSGQGNLSLYYFYQNQKLDELIEQSTLEVDPKTRKQYFYQIHKLLNEEEPVVFLFIRNSFHALRSQFVGTDSFFNTYLPFHTFKNWAQKSSAR